MSDKLLKPEQLAEIGIAHEECRFYNNNMQSGWLFIAHGHRQQLLDHITALEDEKEALRDLLREAKCTNVSHSNTSAVTGHCDFCVKREELLSEQEQGS